MRQKRFLCLKGIVFAWLFTILLAAGGQHVCFAAEENVPQQTVYDISTGGIAIRYLTDARIEDILNDGYEPISDGEYEQCLSVMLKDVLVYYDEGIPSNQYEYEETDIEITPAEYVITSVVLALIPGAIVFLVLVLFCKLRNGKYKYDAHESGTVNIKKHSDVLVNTVVTHRHIEEKKAEDSGRSTVHTSSSGVKHGGGSKKF